jgi:methanogenic corrinoid protein MtbC1
MASIEKRIYDGNRAKEVLDNEVFQQVFADIEQELFQAWTESPARDQEGREKIHQYQQMLKKVKAHLTSTFETGKLAHLDLEHQKTMLQHAKAFLR